MYSFGQGCPQLMIPEGHAPFYSLLSDRKKGPFATFPRKMKV
jgi:hypothetical protein